MCGVQRRRSARFAGVLDRLAAIQARPSVPSDRCELGADLPGVQRGSEESGDCFGPESPRRRKLEGRPRGEPSRDPPQSGRVCRLMAPLRLRNWAQRNQLRPRSLVVESKAETVASSSRPSSSLVSRRLAFTMSFYAQSASMPQSRLSLASASVLRATSARNPRESSRSLRELRRASISRRLSRDVNGAKARARNWLQLEKRRPLRSSAQARHGAGTVPAQDPPSAGQKPFVLG